MVFLTKTASWKFSKLLAWTILWNAYELFFRNFCRRLSWKNPVKKENFLKGCLSKQKPSRNILKTWLKNIQEKKNQFSLYFCKIPSEEIIFKSASLQLVSLIWRTLQLVAKDPSTMICLISNKNNYI